MPSRCFWVDMTKPHYVAYHDAEWGVPVHDDRHLFEMLILEGAQAGLSWETILRRREGYRAAFHNFDPVKVAALTDDELEHILKTADIIRNRLKVFATRRNAALACAVDPDDAPPARSRRCARGVVIDGAPRPSRLSGGIAHAAHP